MFQKFILVGNLGADPEMRFTPSGAAYVRFSVAVSRKWNDAQGQKQEETTWYRCTAWGNTAESVNQFCRKGSLVLVEGDQIRASAYLTRDNQPAASLEVTARQVRFLNLRNAGQGGAGTPADGHAVETALEDDEIPF